MPLALTFQPSTSLSEGPSIHGFTSSMLPLADMLLIAVSGPVPVTKTDVSSKSPSIARRFAPSLAVIDENVPIFKLPAAEIVTSPAVETTWSVNIRSPRVCLNTMSPKTEVFPKSADNITSTYAPPDVAIISFTLLELISISPISLAIPMFVALIETVASLLFVVINAVSLVGEASRSAPPETSAILPFWLVIEDRAISLEETKLKSLLTVSDALSC